MTARADHPIGLRVSALKIISRLHDIAPRYKAILCDAWGVIHNGVDMFPGVEEAMVSFRQHYGPLVILTNAPRPSSIIPGQLDRLGLSREAYDSVVTSGDAVRAEIIKRLPGPFFRIGPEKDDPLFADLDITFVPLEEAQVIICTGLNDDTSETPEDYASLLQQAATLGLPMICANPDIVVRWGERLIYCAGALAQLYEGVGGSVIYGGKPYTPIYDLALERLKQHIPNLQYDDILAIGDGPNTDILGANNHKIDALFMIGGGGIHQGGNDEAAVRATLAEAGLTAIGAMETLQW